MDHRCCFGGSPGAARLRLKARNEADVDDGAPGADHPVMINLAALCPGDIEMSFPGECRRGTCEGAAALPGPGLAGSEGRDTRTVRDIYAERAWRSAGSRPLARGMPNGLGGQPGSRPLARYRMERRVGVSGWHAPQRAAARVR